MNSKVYLADDPQLGGKLAIKEVEKSNFVNAAGYFEEAQAIFGSSHENVVPIRYACETNDHVCLAMPYYKNGSLQDRIQDGPLQLSEIVRVGQGILTGVTQIHIYGSLHFDIKPSNILFSDHDKPMLADFGQARTIGANGLAVPTGVYRNAIPPELILYQRGTIQTDLFQVGLTLYRASNGDRFYRDQIPAPADLVQAILDGKFPDRNRFMPHVPRALRSVIRKSLSISMSDRYANAAEFAQALGKVKIKHDWQTTIHPDGSIEWRCFRPGQPTLMVAMRNNAGKWDAKVHHERQNQTSNTKKSLWKTNLTHNQCSAHLKGVFEALE